MKRILTILFFLILFLFSSPFTFTAPLADSQSNGQDIHHSPQQFQSQQVVHSNTIQPSLATNWNKKEDESVNQLLYDVVVVGSEPEGIMAAIAAAREGQKTLLIDQKPIVGGLYTLGKLNMLDINWSPTNESLNKGLFLEFFSKINYRTSFDVKQTQQVFEEMLQQEKNITVELNVKHYHPIMNNLTVEALFYEDQMGNIKKILGKKYIDATTDAVLADLAGADFTIGQEDYRNEKKMMAVTLVFELSNVDWEQIKTYLNFDNDPNTGANQHSAWGYGEEMAQYTSKYPNMRIRALNIGRQNNGNVLINALQILNVNGLNKQELKNARLMAEDELPRIVEFLRKHLVGFENVQFVGTADEFYVRETRHLQAEYILTVDDVLENRDFEDRIAYGSYPIDVQATEMGEGDLIIGNPTQYAIPFRSIVPKGFTNLLVVGRSAGFDSLAHGSARTVPIGMTIGQAAGIASAYANEKQLDFQNIITDPHKQHMKNIQMILNRNGAKLEKIPLYDNPIVRHWAYEGVKFLRSFGLIAAGYNNDYKMDHPLSKKEFIDLVTKTAKYTKATFSISFPFSKSEEDITFKELSDFLTSNQIDEQRLNPIVIEKIKEIDEEDRSMSRDITYMVIKDFFEIKQLLEGTLNNESESEIDV